MIVEFAGYQIEEESRRLTQLNQKAASEQTMDEVSERPILSMSN